MQQSCWSFGAPVSDRDVARRPEAGLEGANARTYSGMTGKVAAKAGFKGERRLRREAKQALEASDEACKTGVKGKTRYAAV